MKSNIQLKYSNYVAFSHFHGYAVNNPGLSILLFIGSYFIILQPAKTVDTTNTPTLILHVSDDQYELYVNGKFSKTLNSTDIKKPQYSKYEIIERSQ